MGIMARLSYTVRSKVNAAVSRAEDPGESLDYSHERLRDELQEVRAGIADLTTQQKRLAMRRRRLEEGVERHETQAREAVEQDREDLARRALEKKREKAAQLEAVEAQVADLEATRESLVETKEDLQRRVDEFRTRKETMKARYEAAAASARVSEAVTGAGDDLAAVNRAVERARDRTRELEARAAALDELTAAGVLESPLDDRDAIDLELRDERGGVAAELESLRAEVNGGAAEADRDPRGQRAE